MMQFLVLAGVALLTSCKDNVEEDPIGNGSVQTVDDIPNSQPVDLKITQEFVDLVSCETTDDGLCDYGNMSMSRLAGSDTEATWQLYPYAQNQYVVPSGQSFTITGEYDDFLDHPVTFWMDFETIENTLLEMTPVESQDPSVVLHDVVLSLIGKLNYSDAKDNTCLFEDVTLKLLAANTWSYSTTPFANYTGTVIDLIPADQFVDTCMEPMLDEDYPYIGISLYLDLTAMGTL